MRVLPGPVVGRTGAQAHSQPVSPRAHRAVHGAARRSAASQHGRRRLRNARRQSHGRSRIKLDRRERGAARAVGIYQVRDARARVGQRDSKLLLPLRRCILRVVISH